MKVLNLSIIFNDKIRTKTELNNLGGVLYRLHHIGTNKNYIGTAKNIVDRMYSDWDGYVTIINDKIYEKYRKIHRALDKFGIENFELIIEKIGNFYTDIDPYESEYIAKYDSFNNGYNDTPDGKSNNKTGVRYNITGRTPIHNPITGVQKFVYPYEIEEYENKGFIKGHKNKPKTTTAGMTWVTNDIINIMIYESDGIPEGFHLGKIQAPKEKIKFMNNGVHQLRVPISLIPEFKLKGYSEGRLNKPGNIGKVTVNKDGKTRYIFSDELDHYINNLGYFPGGAKRNRKSKNSSSTTIETTDNKSGKE